MTSKRQKAKGWLLPEEITDHELVCVQMLVPNDPDYIAAFRGNLDQLTKSWNWERSYTEGDDRAARASVYWRRIIFNSLEIGVCEGSNRICTEFSASASIVSYLPYDPFKDPNTVPSGYLFSPFVVVQPGDLIASFAGYHLNDVLVTLRGLPNIPTIATKGFPSFRVSLPSPGDVTLHLLNVEFGGSAIIIIDGKDNNTTSKIIDMQHSPGTDEAREHDVVIKLTGEGSHTIDVTFVPELVPTPRFGGGLRGFEFCSTETFTSHIVTECEDELNLRIKPDNCTIIQAQCSDGTWQDWYNPACKANGSNGTAQQSHDDNPPKAGESKCYPMVLNGNDIKFIPIPVNDGDIITITEASGSWNDGGFLTVWYCPDGSQNILQRCYSQFNDDAQVGDPLQDVYHMRLVGKIGSAFVDVIATGGYVVPSGTGAQTFYLQANDSDITNNKGSISFNVCVQKAADPATLPENQTWCFTFDFTVSTYGWTPDTGYAAYSAGNGWTFAPGASQDNCLIKSPTLAATTHITSIKTFITIPMAGDRNAFYFSKTGSVLVAPVVEHDHITALSDSATFDDDSTGIGVGCETSTGNSPDFPGYLYRVVVKGTGTIPAEFGVSNC